MVRWPRSLAIVVLLSLSLLAFQIGTVETACQDFSNLLFSAFTYQRKVNFYMYKNAQGNPRKVSCQKRCNLKNVSFNPGIRTTIIIHGFLNDHNTDWVQSLIQQLFAWKAMNIIVVDWSEMFNVNYYQSAKRVPTVASEIRKFIQQLAKKFSTNLKDWPYIHFIGHSLGAHVAGQAALLLKPDVFVHQITALDPAKPYFDDKGSHLKLKKSYAQFVDVIHVNCSPGQYTFGTCEPLGHIDFYPNGGDFQPNCKTPEVENRFFITRRCWSELIFGVDTIPYKINYLRRKRLRRDNMMCDHNVGNQYFIDSIMGKFRFAAKKIMGIPNGDVRTGCSYSGCSGPACVQMGINSFNYKDMKYHGMYYLNTQCG